MKLRTGLRSYVAMTGLSVVFVLAPWNRLIAQEIVLKDRVTHAIEDGSYSMVPGHLHPLAVPARDQGHVDGGVPLQRITMMLKPSDTQQASLDAFLTEVQDPSSPQYQHWLAPEEFADRFGVSRNDIDTIVSWLQAE